MKRQPELRERLDDLEVEHQILSSMTLEFADGLRRVVNGVTVGREWLIKTGRSFVDTCRQHMKSENAGVFLLAREHLTAENLELAEADFHPIADSLFGGATEERFARLLTSIEIAAGLS